MCLLSCCFADAISTQMNLQEHLYPLIRNEKVEGSIPFSGTI